MVVAVVKTFETFGRSGRDKPAAPNSSTAGGSARSAA
jgi:hypothetical protein